MSEETFSSRFYKNPVYPFSFPDPFILKFRGEYFAYCTGFASDGNVFGILRSHDLVHWSESGGAMQPLANGPPFYWAPEVTYAGGKFYLYYSVGNETLMEIRVAVSRRPDGGFVDSGNRLTREDFAIDAHIFTDTDGTRYMFYATDFLEYTHIGTGTVIDRMLDWFTLEGRPRPVTRAKYDWQVYDPARKEKGGVRWHTVEGPFVLKRKGRYYEMFSGGNWQNVSYGVSFATTDDIAREEEWTQFSDGKKVLPILRTLPGVVGPGHNSVIRGPDNRELFCVYHRWEENQRVMAIDRMDFVDSRVFIIGATDVPQPAPSRASVGGFLDRPFGETGAWKILDAEVRSLAGGNNEIVFLEPEPYYLAEINIENTENSDYPSGFILSDEEGKIFELRIFTEYAETWTFGDRLESNEYSLPVNSFLPAAVRHLRVDVNGNHLGLALNDSDIRIHKTLPGPPDRFALNTEAAGTIFSGLGITRGFENLFDHPGAISETGWESLRGGGNYFLRNGELILSGPNTMSLSKGPFYTDYEFVVNIRLVEKFDQNYEYGFEIVFKEEPALIIGIKNGRVLAGEHSFDLPAGFLEAECRQFRILKIGRDVHLRMEDRELGSIPAPAGKSRVAVFCGNASIALEMVRVTDRATSLTSLPR